MLAAQSHDPRLDLGRHAVWAGRRAVGAVGQGADTALRVPAQPAVDRLARHPVPARHLGDREALHDLKDCPVALLHDSQFDEHDACPPRIRRPKLVVYSRQGWPGLKARRCSARAGAGVARLPEPRPALGTYLPKPMWKGCTRAVQSLVGKMSAEIPTQT